MQGRIEQVTVRTVGSTLFDDHAAGATQLLVTSASSFSSESGDIVDVEGSQYVVTARVDSEVDGDPDTLTITPGLAAFTEAGTTVALVPVTTEKIALVRPIESGEDAPWVVVPYEMAAQLPDGVRDVEEQESVEIERNADGEWTITELAGVTPVLQAEYIDELPMPETSDGLAPTSSPAPEVVGGIGAFFVKWVPPVNADPLTYELHVSQTPNFTASSATLVAETPSTLISVRRRPGTPSDQDDLRFAYDTDYYFAVIAKDADGAAPKSTEVAAQLHQITGPDVAAKTIIGENIAGETLTGDLFAGQVVLGSTISTGAIDENGNIVGARVELGPAGLMNFDSEGNPVVKLPLEANDDAFVRAHMEMLSADVLDNFSMFGTNNQIAKDGKLMLSQGTMPPTTPPTVSYAYDTVQLDTNTAKPPHTASNGYNLGTFALNPAQITSIVWDSQWSCWCVCQQKSGGFRIWRFTGAGAIYNNLATGRAWLDDYNDRSMAVVGPSYGGGIATLFKSGTDWYIWGHRTNGTGEINRIPSSWILHSDQSPSLGYDYAANRYILWQNNGGGGGTLQARRFYLNAYSGSGAFPNATSSGVIEGAAGSASAQETRGLVYGSQIDGVNTRYVHGWNSYVTIEVHDTNLVRKNTDGAFEDWTAPAAHLGLAHDGTSFVTVDSTGKLTKYENWNWPQLNATAKIGAALRDTDPAGDQANPHPGQAAGTHETPVGAILTFTQRRRAKLVITASEVPDAGGPDDPDKWALYWYRGTSATPTKTDFKFIDAIGSPTARTTKTITADPTGANPPGGIAGQAGAVNNFPNANPARLVSTGIDGSGNPYIDLTGDGSGRVGPYKWDKTGKQVDGDPTYDTGWVTWGSNSGNDTAWTSGTVTTCQYRRIGKVVHVRMFRANGSDFNPANNNYSDQTVRTGLPTGIRPTVHVSSLAMLSGLPQAALLTTAGSIILYGGFSGSYPAGSSLYVDFHYMLG